MEKVTVLIPTYSRLMPLGITLLSLAFQKFRDFKVIVSDQSEKINILKDESMQSVIRLLKFYKIKVKILKHLPRLGIAENRNYLLSKSRSVYSLFLDDDLILEPNVLENMISTIEEEKCGFVGEAPIGLSFINDVRPDEELIELWDSKVKPEIVMPKNKKWQRYKLHNAANILHVNKLKKIRDKKYKVSWIGGCVLYDTKKLKKVGGYEFWKKLPKDHCGEDVLAQMKLMKRFGGCGIIPSGVYHQELKTTLPKRKTNASEVLTIND